MRVISSLKNLTSKFKSGKKVENISISGRCPVCEKEVGFYPLPSYFLEKYKEHDLNYPLSQFETLNVEDYSCSNCGASDRDRLIALYFKRFFEKDNRASFKLIDFGPSGSISKYIKKITSIDYLTADYYRKDVDEIVDIRAMNGICDNSFDAFICSHVLEHIDKDVKAMEELYRITKDGGIGLLLVPIALNLKESVENEEYLQNDHLKWKYFAQNDHVRMYSKTDFVVRLSSVGFQVEQCGSDFFGEEVFKTSGIAHSSVLYVVRK